MALLRGYFLGGAQVLPLPWVKDIPRMSTLPPSDSSESKPRMKRSFSLKFEIICFFFFEMNLFFLIFLNHLEDLKLLVDLRNWMRVCYQISWKYFDFRFILILFFQINAFVQKR